ncbi:hypothetical protein [Marinomonas shanghaiensis]|uniref:hypothetical protein n=1 Tax=Marinomonas shanghaiensis TaxID=2202418 RepID=UPI003A923781
MKNYILGLLSLFFLQGCADMITTTTFGTTPISFVGVSCERAINYESNSIDISGIEVPMSVVGTSNLIKVGELNVGQEKIREASDLIKSIDMLQYSTCQDMLLISSESSRMILSERKNKLILLLTQTVNNLDSAATESEYDKTTEKAKADLDLITNG